MQFEFSAEVDKVLYRIRTSGDTLVPNERVDDHAHKHFLMEFHCVFAGSETIYLPQQCRQILLTPGQILLIPSEVYHGVTTDGGTVERLCFRFNAELLEKGHSPIFQLYRSMQDVLLFEDKQAFNFAAQSRLLYQQEDTPLSRIRQGMLLLNTVLQLFAGIPGSQTPAPREVSRTDRQKWIIEQYIEKHFAADTGIEGLAEELFLSQRQTRKLVCKYLGEDFKTVIIRRRMELAEILLKDTSSSLEEIAWKVGYKSYSGFQLCFKKHFGMTPSQMRKQLSE